MRQLLLVLGLSLMASQPAEACGVGFGVSYSPLFGDLFSPQALSTVRIVPSFKNGKPDGFKLFSMKQNSIFYKIGFRNGDVIQKINGEELASPGKVLELYQSNKEKKAFTVELVRRGKPQTLILVLAGDMVITVAENADAEDSEEASVLTLPGKTAQLPDFVERCNCATPSFPVFSPYFDLSPGIEAKFDWSF